MNICRCGAQAGYPHDVFCPFPLFRGSEKQQNEWKAQWEANRKAAQQGVQRTGFTYDVDGCKKPGVIHLCEDHGLQ